MKSSRPWRAAFIARRIRSSQAQSARLEALESRELLSAFVSTSGVGNWSALSTWASQDGAAVTRIPTSGDTVTINGKVTVDVATSIGTGSGDVIVLSSSANVGDKKLIVSAPLTVQGSIKVLGKSVVDVQAGAGLEFDAAAGVQPKVHAPDGSTVNLYFHGTSASRAYMRTKVGTAGQPVVVTSDVSWMPCNVAATYTDFTDVNGGPSANGTNMLGGWGLDAFPDATALMTGIDHSVFTRSTLVAKGAWAEFTLSNSYFEQGLMVPYGDTPQEAYFIGSGGHVSLVNNGFDLPIWVETMKSIAGNVLQNGLHFNPWAGTPGVQTWSDNIWEIQNASDGYFNPMSGTYSRTYIFCPVANASNPHLSEIHQDITYNQFLFDVPTAHDVDDAIMSLYATNTNNSVQRCLSLPSMAGAITGSGMSIGFAGGTNLRYDHNTVAVGSTPGINSDPSHGGLTGGLAEFKSNIGYSLDSTPAGRLINTNVTDLVLAANCDYNAKYRSTYGLTSSGTPGAHDVNDQNPNFIDPSRNLIKWYRMQPGVTAGTVYTDAYAATDWMRTHPGSIPAMIDWVSNGYIPTNIALKAAADNTAPTDGWIGAMEGKPVGDANLDGKTNFQDYILLERNFGTSYVSAAPTPDVATPIELAANITPVTATDLPVSTPVVGPVAPAYLLNGTATAGMASTLFSGDAPMALPTMSGTGPSLRTVTWPKAQKWQVPPVKGAIDAMTIDLLGALAM